MEEYAAQLDGLKILVLRSGTVVIKEVAHSTRLVVTAQDPFFAGLAAWRIARRLKAPLHLQLHGDFFGPEWKRQAVGNRIRLVLGKFLIRRAAGFRVVSERIARSLVGLGIPRSRIIVAPIASDPCSHTSKYGSDDTSVVFLTVTRLAKEKNPALAVRVFEKIRATVPDARLIVVGDGPLRPTMPQVEGVQYVGWATDPDEWYHRADVFLMTSNAEGWGRTAADAIAHGLPVVTTDVGLAGELVRDGENGLVVPVGDEEAFADAMRRIGSDSALRARLSEGARQTKIPTRSETIDLIVKSWQNTLV